MLIDIAVFVVGAIVGAFSHKWLSAEFTKVTGASAQAVANTAKADVAPVVAAVKADVKKV